MRTELNSKVNNRFVKLGTPAQFLAMCALASGLLLQGCAPATEFSNVNLTNQIATGDTSENSLDWAGTYQGVIPCASCEGIQTTLTLNQDGSYLLSSTYLGEAPGEVFEQSGSFQWDAAGQVVKLQHSETPVFFRVEENAARQLDLEGQRITGPLADHYRLSKVTAETAASNNAIVGFTDIDWQLTELQGEVVAPDKGVYIHFVADGSVYGYSGCNQFSGSWQQENQRLVLEQLAVTMRACTEPLMQLEQVFLAQLAVADNYSQANSNLSLNKARMAPLARFTVKPVSDDLETP